MASASLPESTRAAVALASALRNREVSAVEVAQDQLARLERVRAAFGGVAAREPDRTLADATTSDVRLRAGTARPLEGVPITVKDWIDVEGWPVAGSSAEHRDRRPERDATAVARLRAAGAVVAGITTALADSPCARPHRQPRDARARWFVLRRGGPRRRGGVAARARERRGRQHPTARGLVRRLRIEAELRPGPAHRSLPAPRLALGRAHGHRAARELSR
jgi:hypothetical protein